MLLHAPGADPQGLIGEGIYTAAIRDYLTIHPDRFRPAPIDIDFPDQTSVALFVRHPKTATLAAEARENEVNESDRRPHLPAA